MSREAWDAPGTCPPRTHRRPVAHGARAELQMVTVEPGVTERALAC